MFGLGPRAFVKQISSASALLLSLMNSSSPNVSQSGMQLGEKQLAACLAIAEQRCRINFSGEGNFMDNRRGFIFHVPLHSDTRRKHIYKRNEKHRQSCITAVATAFLLANNTLRPQTHLVHKPIPSKFAGDAGSEWRYIPELAQRAKADTNDCLVYAFGVHHRDEFANFYAAQGCEVFAFDPTVSYYATKDHSHGVRVGSITFLSWGLTSTEVGCPYSEVLSVGHLYGKIRGQLYSLPQIVAMLGHWGRKLSALKLDCEGCEFATFRDLWCSEQLAPAHARPIRVASLVVEAHLMYSETLPRLATSADVERIRYLGLWLQDHQYRAFQFRTHEGFLQGYRGGIRMLPRDLEVAGIDPRVCCYLVGFVREDLVDPH